MNVRSRVARLESGRSRRGGAACRVCGGDGYPGVYVQTDRESEPRRVGQSVCGGCGRVGVGAVVVLPGGEHWSDDDGERR